MRTSLAKIAILLLSAALSSVAAAQQAPAAPAQPDMSKRPAIGPVKPYTPPASFTDQLPNGLRIIVVEDHRFPLVSVRLGLRGGSSLLPADQAGLADAEAELLTAGTPSMNARQIAEESDRFGGAIDASSGEDFLTVSASALSSRTRRMFRLLADVILHPTFPDDEVTLRKQNMLQELALQRSEPSFLSSVQFNRVLFGRHPYSITAPTEASIQKISRSALEQFHQRVFLPNNSAVLVVVGDIRASMADNLAQQFFGDWHFGNPAPPSFPAPPEHATRRIYVVDRPGSAQSTVMLGNFGITRDAPDYFPFLVANEVLGGSFNSRLVADVREQKGYAYGIGSVNLPKLLLGSWLVSTEVRTPVTADAVAEILRQLDRIRSAPPSNTELEEAKNYLAGSFTEGLQTQDEVADQFLRVALYRLPKDYLKNWVQRVQSVTADQALNAARAHIRPGQEVIVIVGDAKQIEPKLAPLASGPITVYNDRGEAVGSYPSSGR